MEQSASFRVHSRNGRIIALEQNLLEAAFVIEGPQSRFKAFHGIIEASMVEALRTFK
jgi:hypothetical protein